MDRRANKVVTNSADLQTSSARLDLLLHEQRMTNDLLRKLLAPVQACAESLSLLKEWAVDCLETLHQLSLHLQDIVMSLQDVSRLCTYLHQCLLCQELHAWHGRAVRRSNSIMTASALTAAVYYGTRNIYTKCYPTSAWSWIRGAFGLPHPRVQGRWQGVMCLFPSAGKLLLGSLLLAILFVAAIMGKHPHFSTPGRWLGQDYVPRCLQLFVPSLDSKYRPGDSNQGLPATATRRKPATAASTPAANMVPAAPLGPSSASAHQAPTALASHNSAHAIEPMVSLVAGNPEHMVDSLIWDLAWPAAMAAPAMWLTHGSWTAWLMLRLVWFGCLHAAEQCRLSQPASDCGQQSKGRRRGTLLVSTCQVVLVLMLQFVGPVANGLLPYVPWTGVVRMCVVTVVVALTGGLVLRAMPAAA